MARSTTDIYNSIMSKKQATASLNGLTPNPETATNLFNDITTKSKVGTWRLVAWICAYAIHIHETLFDQLKIDIDERAAEIIPGTARWLRNQAFIFQNGDQLVWDGEKYVYQTINASLQIIKRAAVVEGAGQVRFKVAKLTGGVPAPLSSSELNSFIAFINQIKPAGTNIAVISKPADLLKIKYDVYYDPLVLNANGSLISSPSIFPVEDAINNYIQNLPFNGELTLTYLTDEVQAAEGVVNPVNTLAEAKYGANPYLAIGTSYVADAGHMIIDPAYPLNTNLNYIPVNV